MFEEAFLRVGERLGSLQTRLVLALILAASVPLLLIGAAIYLRFEPLALCRQQVSSLYFGTAMPDRREVEAGEWGRFIDEAIVPRLPDGFTLQSGQGVWRSPKTGDTIREDTRILMVLHESARTVNDTLDLIAADYKARFRQESVLRVDQCAVYRF